MGWVGCKGCRWVSKHPPSQEIWALDPLPLQFTPRHSSVPRPSAAIATAAQVSAKLIIQTFFFPPLSLSGCRSSFISPSTGGGRAALTGKEGHPSPRRRCSAEIWRWHFLWKREWLGLPSPSAVVELLSSSYLAFPSSDIQQGRSSIKRNVLIPPPLHPLAMKTVSLFLCVCS